MAGSPQSAPLAGLEPVAARVEHRFAGDDALAEALADDLAGRLRDAIAARGMAVLAVSGGRSPVALLRALRQRALPWARLTVTLVDDRCVPPAHPDSNARLVREHLLVGDAAQAGFVPLLDVSALDPAPDTASGDAAATGPADALAVLAADAHARIAALGTIDVAVLGMGTDGHTASLFAPVAYAAGALDPDGTMLCAALVPPHAPHARVTLTLSGLLRARHLVLQLAGTDKRAVYEQARRGPDPQRAISLVLDQRRVPLEAWIAD